MWENEKNLHRDMRITLPQYLNINHYLFNVCQNINDVALEDYYGSSDMLIVAEKIVDSKDKKKLFLIPFTVELITKAISSRKSYLKIVKKGYKKSTYTKDIAQQIYEKIKADEGGCQGVEDYIYSFEF